MSNKIATIASKLNSKDQVSKIMDSRGTEIEGDKVIALDLSELNISDLPPGLFDGLDDLERLNLGYNELTKVKCLVKLFKI